MRTDIFIIVTLWLMLAAPLAYTQEAVPVEPVDGVKTQPFTLDDLKSPVVLELFSSEICTFCPQAEKILHEMANHEHIITLTCYVDYFNAAEDLSGPARPYCKDRQERYTKLLQTGMPYTPQLVVNGTYDIAGHKRDKVMATIEKSLNTPLAAIPVRRKADEPSLYSLTLPALDIEDSLNVDIVFHEKPLDTTNARGEKIVYTGLSGPDQTLNTWDGNPQIIEFETGNTARYSGFIVLARHPETARIFAAGHYQLP